MTRRLTFLALSALVCLPLAARTARAAGGPAAPKAVCPASSDLVKGFQLTSSGAVNNAQMAKQAHLAKSVFDKKGRITGYSEQYTRNSFKAVAIVECNAYTYRTAAGATWDYTNEAAHSASMGKKVSAAGVGQGSAAFLVTFKSGGKNWMLYVVDFHHGRFVALVGAGGVKGQVSVGDALSLARVVDRKIVHAGA